MQKLAVIFASLALVGAALLWLAFKVVIILVTRD